MNLTLRHLGPIFENVTDLLIQSPDQLRQFEAWAVARVERLRQAGRAGRLGLEHESALLREELEELGTSTDFEALVTQRTERLRMCQRQWLTGLLDLLDDLLAAASSGGWSAAA